MIVDLNDGKPWSDTDDADLRNAVAQGVTAEAAAEFLCRAGTVDDVKERAWRLGKPFTDRRL